MFCPNCRNEYAEGIQECMACKVLLVDAVPPLEDPSRDGDGGFFTVFMSGNPATVAVAKSLLESAGIRCFVKGEELQNLFGWRGLGQGFEVQVAGGDAEVARAILTALPEGESEDKG